MNPAFRYTPPSTPALVVSRTALDANIATMQGFCDAAGVALRAHGKMHKCSTLAHLQIAGGAVGVCAQTIGEAEAFARSGIADILITAPIAPWAAARIADLARAGTAIKVVADCAAAIDWLDDAAREAGISLGVVVDLDLGLHRAGAYPEHAVPLAQRISACKNLSFEGVQAYLGHIQHLAATDRRTEAALDAHATLRSVIDILGSAGLPPRLVTGGGTGTYATDLASGVFNELQAGSYAFMDAEYGASGAPGGGAWPFRAALFVAASVVSANHKSHVTIDAGLKALSSDGPPARVVGGAAPGSMCRSMGDEHSAIFHPSILPLLRASISPDPIATATALAAMDSDAALPWPEDAPHVGDIVWLQPGHCDPTVNLYDQIHVVGDDGSCERWIIDARRSA